MIKLLSLQLIIYSTNQNGLDMVAEFLSIQDLFYERKKCELPVYLYILVVPQRCSLYRKNKQILQCLREGGAECGSVHLASPSLPRNSILARPGTPHSPLRPMASAHLFIRAAKRQWVIWDRFRRRHTTLFKAVLLKFLHVLFFQFADIS